MVARTVLLVLAALPVCAGSAQASWRLLGSGNGSAHAKSLAPGATPTAKAGSNGSGTVVVSWAVSSFAEGGAAPGYLVRRYSATLGTVSFAGGTCAGLVTSLMCIDSGVPKGDWKYSVTPAAGNWRGAESAKSTTVTVR